MSLRWSRRQNVKSLTRHETARLVVEAFNSMAISIHAARTAGLDLDTYLETVRVMWQTPRDDDDE